MHDVVPVGRDDHRPHHAWSDTVIYELHVKGFTALHPDIPPALRGTYAGLAHPAAIEHLHRARASPPSSCMPVHHFVTEPHLLRRGLTNYWGYNSIGYFAPHAAYCASGPRGEQVREFKAMVRALHAAGIEVILDVVYNHTAEGDQHGPDAGLPRHRQPDLLPAPRTTARYRDYTGSGNTLDVRHPHVLQLIMDSLRYWVTEMHVDGFRFDLASALARSFHDVDKLSAFFDVIQQDPVVSQVKLIAEPWDIGEGGYQVGEFPPLWTEWNGKYRDTVRDFWRGARPACASSPTGCPGRATSTRTTAAGPTPPSTSSPRTTASPCATSSTYEHKHNEANGEDNRDGDDHNRSWNCGVEGETDDPEILALRRRQVRNFLTTLLLSTGVPMLSTGDEIGRTQRGNNNAYCQDNEISWMRWDEERRQSLCRLVRRLVALRRPPGVPAEGVLPRPAGRRRGGEGPRLVRPDGVELSDPEWFDPQQHTIGMYLDGGGIRTRGPRGERVVDDSFLLIVHAGSDDRDMTLPGPPWASAYDVVLDTCEEDTSGGQAYPAGAALPLMARSAVLLRSHPLIQATRRCQAVVMRPRSASVGSRSECGRTRTV